jgi:tetrahydromethanopterin S-methyltransferase subunit G
VYSPLDSNTQQILRRLDQLSAKVDALAQEQAELRGALKERAALSGGLWGLVSGLIIALSGFLLNLAGQSFSHPRP